MASPPSVLQAKVDQFEVDVDAVKAWLNDTTGTANIPIIGGTIPSLLKVINQVLATVPVRGYLTQTALLADLTPGDKTVAFAADTQNQYVKSGAPGAGSWTAAGTSQIASILSRLTAVESLAGQNSVLVAAINTLLGMPTAADFANKAGYTKAHGTLGSYASNVTETENSSGFTIAAGSGLPAQITSGVRMSYDMVVGDTLVLEGKVTSGSVGSGIGPFIGVDVNTSGDFTSGNLNIVIWRNAVGGAGMYGGSYNGAANSTYDPTPAASTQPAPFTTNDLLRMEARILAGRQVLYRLFKNGVKVAEATQLTAFPAGRVAMGFTLLPSVTVQITKAYRQGFNGDTLYISGSATVSGNGMYHAPYKTVNEARNAAVGYGLKRFRGVMLSGTVADALIADSGLFAEYELFGIQQVRMEAAETSPTDLTLVGGTTRVYTRTNKNLAGIANTFNSGATYVIGKTQSSSTPGVTWYTFPNYITPATGVAPTSMDTITTGARRVTGGNFYLRTPDGIDPNPAVAPIKVNISESALHVIGNAKVTAENVIFAYGGAQCIYAGGGSITLINCGVEWGESNGIQAATGTVRMLGGYVKYVGNDCINRTLPAGTTSAINTPWFSEYRDVEIAYTIGGDGQSDHGIEVNGARSKLSMTRCYIHDVAKDGVVPASCDTDLDNCIIENAANASLEVICGNDATLPNGLRAYVVARNCIFDPKGNGLYGVLISGYAGGISRTRLFNVWIGAPAAGGGELWAGPPVAVSGRTHSASDWVLEYTNCTTQRAAGSVVKNPGGNATFTPVAANALT